jgi:putative membrane protein
VRDPGQARVRPTDVTIGRTSATNLTLAASVAAIFLLGAGGLLLLSQTPVGPVTRHMTAHILLMNAVAPAIVLAILWNGTARTTASGGMLTAATVAQMGLLWAAHAPPALAAAAGSAFFHSLTQIALFGASLWFWWAVLTQRHGARWRALFALLVSGKLFCLLAVLLVFAPRFFYGEHGAHSHGGPDFDQLADQHLAGVLMLVVCPLSYVAAAVVIAARWLRELTTGERDASPISSRQMAAQ